MWGRLAVSMAGGIWHRFIPTYVGQTSRQEFVTNLLPVHPHVCGADTAKYPDGQGDFGSSPRMWGRPSVVTSSRHAERFTPTYVGQTRQRWR